MLFRAARFVVPLLLLVATPLHAQPTICFTNLCLSDSPDGNGIGVFAVADGSYQGNVVWAVPSSVPTSTPTVSLTPTPSATPTATPVPVAIIKLNKNVTISFALDGVPWKCTAPTAKAKTWTCRA